MNKKLARAVAPFVQRLRKKDAWLVPGREGRRYLVQRQSLSYSCNLIMNSGKILRPCYGNLFYICYHVGAAVLSGAAEKGNEVSFCDSEADAERVSRFGGQVFEMKSGQSGKSMQIVVRERRKRRWKKKKRCHSRK